MIKSASFTRVMHVIVCLGHTESNQS